MCMDGVIKTQNMPFWTFYAIAVGTFALLVQGENIQFKCPVSGNSCILLNIDAKFNLTRLSPHYEHAASFDLSDARVVEKGCKCPSPLLGKPRELVLEKASTGEQFEFQFQVSQLHASLQMIYHLDPSKHFKGERLTVDMYMDHAKGLGPEYESYLCKTDEMVSFLDKRNEYSLVMDMKNFQVQAYNIVAGQFSFPYECSQDLTSVPASTSPHTTAKSTISSTLTSTVTTPKTTPSTLPPTKSSTQTTKTSSTKPSTSPSPSPSSPSTITPVTSISTTHTPMTSSPTVSTQPSPTQPSSTVTSPITTKKTTSATSHTTSRRTASSPKSTHTTPSVPTHSSPTHSSSSMSPSPSSSMSTGSSPKTTQTTKPSTQSSHTSSGSTHKVTTGSQPTTHPTSSQMTTQATTPASVLPKFGLKDPDGQYYCIVIQGKIEFEIPYTTTDGKASTLAIELPRNATVTGSCSLNGTNNTQEITLSFFNGWSFNLVIGTLTEDFSFAGPNVYSWEKIDMTYVLDDHFYNPKNKGQRNDVSANPAFDDFKATSKGCFKCTSRQAMKLKTVTLDLSDLEYFGFGLTDSEDFPNTDIIECAADHAQTTMSPSTKSPSHSHGGAIAGGIIGGLVVVALVVGSVTFYRRKMNKATPYEDL